jgi:sortase (surface protein transpeptidase)
MRYPQLGGRGRDLLLISTAAILGAGAAVLVMGSVVSQPPAAAAAPRAPSTTSPANPVPPLPTPAVAPVQPYVFPDHISIPAINVSAAVEQVGLDSTGSMGVPSKTTDTAWYDDGPTPGQPGDAVIDGHLDWYSGPAVFWNLGRLKPGEEILLQLSNGQQLGFEVTSVHAYPLTATVPGLFDVSGPPRLSLITCAGQWDASRHVYLQRLVVTALPFAPAAGSTG